MRDQEEEELQQELIGRWTEVHKKSMVMFLIMLALTDRPMWSKELEKWLLHAAGWDITERGLHRTLKRMNHLGLVEYNEISAPKTGIKRKNYRLTGFGLATLKKMKVNSLKYWHNDDFAKAMNRF